MSSRGSTRGGRGSRGGRGGRGASATAAAPSARPSTEQGTTPGANSGDSDAAAAGSTTARAVTIESGQSAAPSPAPVSAASSARGRFKPKNIRRDAAERQKLEDERSRDLAAKIKVEEREQRDAERRARRGGGGRGRGRGDAGGHFVRRTAVGPFSGISQDAVKQGGSWGGYGTKTESGYRYQNRRANDVRVNIDALRDSDAPDDLANGTKSPATLPVGIIRVEHKEAELKVATSAELEAEEQEGDDDDDDDGLFVSAPAEAPSVDDDEVWTTGSEKPQDKDLKIKPEPGMDDDAMEIDNIPKAPDSPELKKKPLVQELEKDAKAKAKEKKREKALQDPEAQAMAMDATALLRGLSLNEGEESERDNKLFLFQFPPVLPPLARVNEDGSEFIDLENGQAENGGVKVKTEPGTTGPMATSSLLPPGGGYIGRLNVRKSGKVELDWGGQLLDLGIATETDFLTTAIIVDEQENDTASGQGKATGMGQIYGKFVATPIFEEEDEWDPDLEAVGLSV